MAQELNRGGVQATGNPVARVELTPTISAALYGAGNVVGGLLTFAGALRVGGSAARLQSLFVADRGNQKAALTLLLFCENPTTSTFTDKVAPTIAAADVVKVIRAIPIAAADYVTIDSKAYADVPVTGRILEATTGTTIWGVLLCTATPTYASTSDLTIRIGVVQD